MTIFEFINHDKVTFSSARTSPNFFHFSCQVKHVCSPSILHYRETQKIFSVITVTQKIIWTRTPIFHYLIDMNISTQNLLVCNSGQYVTDLSNFFFVVQDLIDRINSYFQRIAFQVNLLLIGFTLHHKFFPVEISSLHWNGTT